jgi:predicted phage terminase large subunit-like protein
MFAGQYRQRPAPPSGGVIKADLISVIDAVPHNVVQWCRGWDLAATIDGAFTAGAKLGRMSDGRFVVADMKRERLASHERDQLMRNTADADGVGMKQSIPQDPGQAGVDQKKAFAAKLAGHTLHFSPESGDKVTRADPFASQVNAGNVVMVRAPWNDAFIEEAKLFPNGKFKDQVDATARAFNGLLGSAAGVFA